MEQLTSNIEYSQINTKHFQGRNSLMCLSITEQAVLVLLLKILTNREEVDCETVNLPLSIVRAAAFLYLPMPYFCSLTSSEHLTPRVWQIGLALSHQLPIHTDFVCVVQSKMHSISFPEVGGLWCKRPRIPSWLWHEASHVPDYGSSCLSHLFLLSVFCSK